GTRLENHIGLRPEQVERVSMVSMNWEKRLDWAVLETTEDCDPDRVIVAVKASQREEVGDRPLLLGEDAQGRPLAVMFIHRRMLVAGPPDGVRACARHLQKSAAPSTPLLDLAQKSRDQHIVGGWNPTEEWRRSLEANPAAAPLADLRGAQIIGTITERARFEARGQASSVEKARSIQSALQSWLSLARLSLPLMALKGAEQARAAQQVGRWINQIKIRPDGTDLTAELDTDAETAASVLILMPALLDR
ncbi:MAG: hypothetical protein ACKO23_16865, partial [Gemmataceae bacterium]